MPIFIVAFLFVLFMGADQLCVNDAGRRLPIYPGAQKIDETHNGIRARGIGSTRMTFESADSQETIEAWYQELQIELLKTRRQLGINNLTILYAPGKEGKGTTIYYLSQCVL